MAKLYLSLPSQSGEEYPNGGEEQYWIGKVADSLEAALSNSGVKPFRIPGSVKEGRVLRAANRGENCLYLMLCSQTAPPDSAGQRKGSDVYYREQCGVEKAAAELFAARLKEIYPQPELEGTRPVSETEEQEKDASPTLLIKLAYRDNPQDEAWLVNNTIEIGEKLAQAAAEALGLPFFHA